MEEKYKILFVDDEENIRELGKRILQIGKYEVDTAVNGKDAFEKIANTYYNVIITDMKMPEIDGLEIIEKVKEISPFTDVIMITGHATVETAMKAISLGAYDYIVKPFDMGKLILLVGHCIERQKLRKEITALKEKLKQYEKNTK